VTAKKRTGGTENADAPAASAADEGQSVTPPVPTPPASGKPAAATPADVATDATEATPVEAAAAPEPEAVPAEATADEPTAADADQPAAAEAAEPAAADEPEPAAEAAEIAAAPADEPPAEVEVTVDTASDDAAESAPAAAAAKAPRKPMPDKPVQTVGRRKQAIVRVRLKSGDGTFVVNGKDLETYFPNKVHQQLIREPLVILDKVKAYDVIASLHGGGISGQAGALRLGIARALIELDIDDRPALKKAGFLTRDPRVKERKKYGLKKARKAPQYSKR